MKKLGGILVLAILGLGLGFIACGDDDDNGNGGGAKFCLEECAANDDCLTDYECQGGTCTYTGDATGCTGNDECIAMFSGWTKSDPECTADADCYAGAGVCLDVGGVGYCAMEKTADCTAPMEAMTEQKLDGGADVEVCGRPSARCKDEVCGVPCAADADCGAGYKCNTTSGDCYQCDSDADCTGTMTKCLSSKFCGCKDDTECSGAGTDKCYNGACGCIATDDCPTTTVHPGTEVVCKGL